MLPPVGQRKTVIVFYSYIPVGCHSDTSAFLAWKCMNWFPGFKILMHFFLHVCIVRNAESIVYDLECKYTVTFFLLFVTTITRRKKGKYFDPRKEKNCKDHHQGEKWCWWKSSLKQILLIVLFPIHLLTLWGVKKSFSRSKFQKKMILILPLLLPFIRSKFISTFLCSVFLTALPLFLLRTGESQEPDVDHNGSLFTYITKFFSLTSKILNDFPSSWPSSNSLAWIILLLPEYNFLMELSPVAGGIYYEFWYWFHLLHLRIKFEPLKKMNRDVYGLNRKFSFLSS